MGKGTGKSKGSAFERRICQHLSLWATNGKRRDVFWRSAMSGGRATLLQRKGRVASNISGDIAAVGKEGHELLDRFSIECKSYKDLGLVAFLLGTHKGLLSSFWNHHRGVAISAGKRPMVIAKQNNMPVVVLLDVIDLPMFIIIMKRIGNINFTKVDSESCLVALFEEAFKLPRPKPSARKT